MKSTFLRLDSIFCFFPNFKLFVRNSLALIFTSSLRSLRKQYKNFIFKSRHLIHFLHVLSRELFLVYSFRAVFIFSMKQPKFLLQENWDIAMSLNFETLYSVQKRFFLNDSFVYTNFVQSAFWKTRNCWILRAKILRKFVRNRNDRVVAGLKWQGGFGELCESQKHRKRKLNDCNKKVLERRRLSDV